MTYHQEWVLKNPDYYKNYIAINKEKLKAYQKEYKEKHKDRLKIYQKEYNKNYLQLIKENDLKKKIEKFNLNNS
jgi:hypothetical protein